MRTLMSERVYVYVYNGVWGTGVGVDGELLFP